MSKRWILACLVLAALLTLCLYGRSLNYGFLVWDDGIHIFDNPGLTPPSFKNLADFWTHPYEHLYIPVTYTLWSIIAAFSFDPTGKTASDRMHPVYFHGINLFLHVLNCLLVFLIVRMILILFFSHLSSPTNQRNPKREFKELRDLKLKDSKEKLLADLDVPEFKVQMGALLGALLFTIHPLQVESIAWATALKHILSGFFSLLTVYFYLHFSFAVKYQGRFKGYYCMSLVSYLLATLSMPTAAAVIPILLVLERCGNKSQYKTLGKRLLPFLVILIPTFWVTDDTQTKLIHYIPDYWERLWVCLDAIGFYLTKIIFPIDLTPTYGRTPQSIFWTLLFFFYLTVSLSVSFLSLKYFRRKKEYLIFLGVFIGGLSPVLGWVPFIHQNFSTVADHYVYLSLLGPSLFLGWLFSRSQEDFRWYRGIKVVSVVMVLFWIPITWIQVERWKNSVTLFSYAADLTPDNWSAQASLGDAFQIEGRYEEAAEHYLKSLKAKSDEDVVEADFLAVLMKLGRYNEMVQRGEEYLNRRPAAIGVRVNVATAFQKLGNLDESIAKYNELLKMDPTLYQVHYNLALILIRMDRFEEAKYHLTEALRFEPYFAPAKKLLMALGQE